MNHIQGYLGGCQTGCEQIGLFIPQSISTISDFYKIGVDKVVSITNEHLPEKLQPIVGKVLHAIPETFATILVVENKAALVGVLFWALRSVLVVSPLIKAMLTAATSKDEIMNALGECYENYTDAYEKIVPAILVCASVGCVHSVVSGFITQDYAQILRGCFYAAIAQLALNDLMRKEMPAVVQDV